jgi:pimeloyl-ACP methyl ester carboxylesterase
MMKLRNIARGAGWSAALLGLGAVGGAAVIAARHALMTPQPLTSGLPGEWRVDRKHGGAVYYAVSGPETAQPLVLLHNFYPGASNFEFRAIYNRLASNYRVYAPDWLGFGMSERPSFQMTGEFYAGMLRGFLRDVVQLPAIVIAHGHAANIAARAAADTPNLFERLVLVAPNLESGERLDPTPTQVMARFFQRVGLGLTPYAALSLRPVLRLAQGRRSIISPSEIDDDTLDHLYASSHQFGAQHGALAALTGDLDLPIQPVFPTLQPPTLVVAGESDRALPPVRLEGLIALNRHADQEIIVGAGATVYQDQPKLFVSTLHRWLGRQIARQAPIVHTQLAGQSSTSTTLSSASAAIVASSRAYSSAVTAPVIPTAQTANQTTPQTPLHTATQAPHSGAYTRSRRAVKIVPVVEPQRPLTSRAGQSDQLGASGIHPMQTRPAPGLRNEQP